MKRSLQIFALLVLTSISVTHFSAHAFAEVPPESAVQDMLAMLRAKANPLPLLDYVDWDTAYQQLEKDSLPPGVLEDVSSARDYRLQVKRMLEQPQRFAESQAEEIIRGLPPRDRATARQFLPLLSPIIEEEMSEFRNKLRRSKFTVGKAKRKENTATVPITVEYEGKASRENVELIQKNSRWYLRSPNSPIFFGAIIEHVASVLKRLRP